MLGNVLCVDNPDISTDYDYGIIDYTSHTSMYGTQ